MRKLIGVYNANGGFVGELAYFFGHLIGIRDCKLCDVTHSPVKKKAAWKEFEKRILEDGYEFVLVHKNERTQEHIDASGGREPCVLIEYEDGSLSMILDWNDLKAAKGDVTSFEKILKSKLIMY
ncbi:MAG: hypothetical protein RI590_04635 [Microbacteriaceae bacterium]|nr:hypothetical protein [Microbacteriaceae bacterium]MDR9444491.1 hypothetical protein [Microbacteriaceae bacterium]